MLHNLHLVTDKHTEQTRSVRTPTDRERQQAPGIYFYKVTTPLGKNYTGKLIKE
jgi:hypothetical protein